MLFKTSCRGRLWRLWSQLVSANPNFSQPCQDSCFKVVSCLSLCSLSFDARSKNSSLNVQFPPPPFNVFLILLQRQTHDAKKLKQFYCLIRLKKKGTCCANSTIVLRQIRINIAKICLSIVILKLKRHWEWE